MAYCASELQKKPGKGILNLLFALSSYEAGDYQTAITELWDLSKLDELQLSEKGAWYLALIYIKSGKEDEAIPLLEKLVVQSSTYKKPAKRMLRKMD